MSGAVTGLGAALPFARLTNADLEARVDTSDAWILERTGIRERRVAGPQESTTTLAIEAGAAAIKDAGLVADDIELLIVATITPEQPVPATAAFVQDGLGLRCGAFDLGAACAGFVYALVSASALVGTGRMGAALVIGAETMSRIVDPDDRTTSVLFGDGAGAAVVQPAPEGAGLLGWDLGCDGSAAGLLEVPAGARWLRMEGPELFRRAVRALTESSARALDAAGLSPGEVDWFVPHQANQRIIDAAAARLGIGPERLMGNLERYGNTSAASIPLALAEAPPSDGDVVLLSGFGAGMTWASAVMRWSEP